MTFQKKKVRFNLSENSSIEYDKNTFVKISSSSKNNGGRKDPPTSNDRTRTYKDVLMANKVRRE